MSINKLETIAHGEGWAQERRKVPRGWIYESTEEGNNGGMTSCCCFVPDPDHEWKLALMEESND